MPQRIIDQILKVFKLTNEISQFDVLTQKERETLALTLTRDTGDGPKPELKLKIYSLILYLKAKIRKPFGLLIVLGWRREWNRKYSAILDINQDIFHEKHFNFEEKSFVQCADVFRRTMDFDGAILISREGHVLASGVYLENMKPKRVAEIIHPSRIEDLSAAFGFAKKVHTRHLSAIASSYILKDTTVFVLSEEDRSARIFEDGRIIWSTIDSEIKRIIREEND